MPEVARFLGIVITLYMEFEEPHHLPHFHARYGEYQATFSISPISQLTGALPRRQLRLVEAWAELHQAELLENWQRAQNGRPILRIQGLA
jgi:hypothetical protein